MAGAQARPLLRQPRLGRAGDRRRIPDHRQRGRAPGPVLGAARRRRELRRRDRVHVPAASGRAGGVRGAAAVRCGQGPRAAAARARPDAGRAAGVRAGDRLPDRAARGRAARAPARQARRGRSRSAIPGRSRTASGWSSPSATSARGGPDGRRSVRRLPVLDRRPARLPELVDRRVPARDHRRGARDDPRQSLATPSPGPAQTFIVPWGGAVARVGEDETPLTQRDATWVVHPFAPVGGPRRRRAGDRLGARVPRRRAAASRPAAPTSTSSATRARTGCAPRTARRSTRGCPASRRSTTRTTCSAGNQNIRPAEAARVAPSAAARSRSRRTCACRASAARGRRRPARARARPGGARTRGSAPGRS